MIHKILLFLILVCLNDSVLSREPVQSLFAAGDTMLARRMPHIVYRRGADYPLGELEALISHSDIAMVNLECVIATSGTIIDKYYERRPYHFRAPPAMLDVLTAVGIDVVTLANNHSMDFGSGALLEELELLELTGITPVGAGRDLASAMEPVYIKSGAAVVAFVNAVDHTPEGAAREHSPGVFYFGPLALRSPNQEQLLINAVQKARDHADLVIVSPHWGRNWRERPTQERVRFTHRLVDAGADAILGHSAHVLQGMEIYRGRPIVYDMGSLMFDVVRKGDRTTAAFQLFFDSAGIHRLSVQPLVRKPGKTFLAKGGQKSTIEQRFEQLSKELDPDIRFTREDGILAVQLDTPLTGGRLKMPPVVYETARTKPLPDAARNRIPATIVPEHSPAWVKGDPVELTHGIKLLGARYSKTVPAGRSFEVEVALQVSGPLVPKWEALLMGRGGEGEKFGWMHPVADGAWIPEQWRPGQIVIDSTSIRSTPTVPGTYNLYWTLGNLKGDWVSAGNLPEKKGTQKPIDHAVPIGSIRVVEDEVAR